MESLILDSTWSFRIKQLIYMKDRDEPVVYFPATMTRYTDKAIKEDYKATMDHIRDGMQDKLLHIGPNTFKTSEIQSIGLRIILQNDLNRGKIRNDMEPALADELAKWYAREFMDVYEDESK